MPRLVLLWAALAACACLAAHAIQTAATGVALPDFSLYLKA